MNTCVRIAVVGGVLLLGKPTDNPTIELFNGGGLHRPPETEMLGWVHTRMSDRAIRFILKPVVFAASVVPVLYWSWATSMHQLNVNPFNAIVRDAGFWSLRFLKFCLAPPRAPPNR